MMLLQNLQKGHQLLGLLLLLLLQLCCRCQHGQLLHY
jgi:hypothetical protein